MKKDELRDSETRSLRAAEAAAAITKKRRRFFVHVDRKPEVQAARLELPVCMHEQEIIEAVHSHDVLLVTGATGTGKTTQVPQFLVEDGFGDAGSPVAKGMVAVTQPRRVAAVSCAKRVAFEMNTRVGEVVGYQIRHEARLGAEAKVKFVTDGVLLREVESDILLRKYSAVVIDEVHERSLNTDLLLSFLSRSVVLRKEERDSFGCLKVIIMSATLDVEGVFAGNNALFPNPPVIKVPSRQYPVTTHFAKRTVDDYVSEAHRKVSKIHRRLPPGGVLIFLSGRQEVEHLCSLLRQEFSDRKVKLPDSDGQELGIRVFPFYALLPEHLQRSVFDEVGDDIRKVVVATNIAETSVTVPGIAYVVDSGRVKEKVYKGAGSTLLSSFDVRWVSKASAEQRAGRAGRTGPGHCYRLYSSAVYDQQFEAFRQPEIRRVPADTIVLRLRAMGILHVHKFPFPTSPGEDDIIAAEKLLTDLGALRSAGSIASRKTEHHTQRTQSKAHAVFLGVTQIGRDLARLPLPPRFGRMLLAAREHGAALRYSCRLSGVLTVGTVLDRSAVDWRRRQGVLRHRRSDLLTELAGVCAAEYAGMQGVEVGRGKRDATAIRVVCERHGLHMKSVAEVLAVSDQLEALFGVGQESALRPPGLDLERVILGAFLCGFPDRVARRMTRDEAAARGVIPRRQRIAFTLPGRPDPVFLEGASSLRLDKDVEFVCFADLAEVEIPAHAPKGQAEGEDDYHASSEDEEGSAETKAATEVTVAAAPAKERRVVMRGATVVQRGWVATEAAGMCVFTRVGGKGAEMAYDAQRDVVVETARVAYGVARWPLGSTRIPVEAPCEGSLRAFATALLCGEVRDVLAVKFGSAEGAMRDAAVRRVAELLRRNGGVTSRRSLESAIRERGDFLSSVIEVCCPKRVRSEVATAWRRGLAEMSRTKDDSDEEGAGENGRFQLGEAEDEDE